MYKENALLNNSNAKRTKNTSTDALRVAQGYSLLKSLDAYYAGFFIEI